ncbi:hypothetical protein FJ417_11510 [Mesorhizobium sp. B3-1-7]|nr:hypothetical protein FJ417_11510 [Mesorhizobium sp. B3-1-7]
MLEKVYPDEQLGIGHSSFYYFELLLIERLYPDMPRLGMFCRSPQPGWQTWGFEAQPDAEPKRCARKAGGMAPLQFFVRWSPHM